jgi:hypothetical protein
MGGGEVRRNWDVGQEWMRIDEDSKSNYLYYIYVILYSFMVLIAPIYVITDDVRYYVLRVRGSELYT